MRPLLATLAAVLPFAVPAAAAAQDSSLAPLAWIAGCWASESGEPGTAEQWLPLAGGTMFGVGRTVKNGKTVSHEFLQIRANADGKPVYIALPSGQHEASFVAASVAPGAVVFENPQHDYPQRIIYRLLPGERLAARIEGTRNGTFRGIDYPMKRVPCDAPAGQAPGR